MWLSVAYLRSAPKLVTLLLALWAFAGVWLFAQSMLSVSVVLPERGSESCGGVRPVDQVVLLLFDAMRPDFVLPKLRRFAAHGGHCVDLPSDALREPHVEPVTLTYMAKALQNNTNSPVNAHGFFLIADAPTTTVQRIKAIATGTMPAFLEAGSNFNSEATVLDSMVTQMEGRAVLLGDDTWYQLLPDTSTQRMWKYTHPIASFDVADFDSCDTVVNDEIYGVLEREVPRRGPQSKHARLIVAHLLGIDHIGHRINAMNPFMDRKLTQLDAMLHNVSRALRRRQAEAPHSRTLLLVLGDHGMTNSGDHGGESAQETDTFLFAQLFGEQIDTAVSAQHAERVAQWNALRWRDIDADPDEGLTRLQKCRHAAGVALERLSTAYQVDIAATVCAALGRPLPFSSIGRVIPELMALIDPDADVPQLERCNLRQVERYYTHAGQPMPATDAAAHDEDDDNDTSNAVRRRLALLGRHARHSRSNMNATGMFVGAWMVLCAAMTLLWRPVVWRCVQHGRLVANWTAIVFVLRLMLPFGNSFAVNEDIELLCLLGTLLCVVAAACVVGNKTRNCAADEEATMMRFAKHENDKDVVTVVSASMPHTNGDGVPDSRCGAGVVIALLLVLRLFASATFRHRAHITHMVESTSALDHYLATHHAWLHTQRRLGIVLGCGLALLLQWLLPMTFTLRSTNSHRVARRGVRRWRWWHCLTRAPPLVLMLLIMAGLMCVSFQRTVLHHLVPLAACLWWCWASRRGTSTVPFSATPAARLHLCYMGAVWWCSSLCSEQTTAAMATAVYGVCLPYLIHIMHSRVPVMTQALVLHLFAYVGFFAEGHQCMFNTLDWNSAFVGMPFYNLYCCAVLVAIRTFNAFLLPPIACALVDAWHAQDTTAESPSHQVRRHDVQGQTRCLYVHLAVAQAAIACLNTYIQKSHLMLYPIFCPKMIFDGCMLAATAAGLVLASLADQLS